MAGSSALGPDGLPYGAWKALSHSGIDVLWASMQELLAPDAIATLDQAYWDDTACPFNLGLVACIPKGEAQHAQDGSAFFLPQDTRPISMVDTSNRLMANAARLRWEPTLSEWVAHLQRGFLTGRSLLANVIDLEEAAMRVSLQAPDGGTVLLDFAAAFPSVSQ